MPAKIPSPGSALRTAACALAIGVAAVSSGCAPHHPPAGGDRPREAKPPRGLPHAAFRATARALVEEKSRKLRDQGLRRAARASSRVEASGPVGGIAMIATGTNGRFRIVVPSRRVQLRRISR